MDSLIIICGIEPCCSKKIFSYFGSHRHHTAFGCEPENIIRVIKAKKPAIIILGTNGSSINSMIQLVKKIRIINRDLPIMLINHTSSEDHVISAFRSGVNDYFKIPVPYEELYASVDRQLNADRRNSTSNFNSNFAKSKMLGNSNSVTETKTYIARIAAKNCTVLITGETGTGKDLAATMIHQLSHRSTGPFISVNCAALPENLVESELYGHRQGAFTGAVNNKKGKFELASGGTLFLDEIGDMGELSQAKILRSIETKEIYPLGGQSAVSVDLRVVAATNKNIEKLTDDGKFRQDLYYRLNIARVHLPPLRKRKEDIPQLVSSAIEKLNWRYSCHIRDVSNEVMTSFFMYEWPGNIRELYNLLESAYINCRSRQIEFKDLPQAFTKRIEFTENSPHDERDKLLTALVSSNWNKTVAAKKLNWSRMRIYRTLKRHNLAYSS